MAFKIESNSTSADCIVINLILGQHDLNILMKLFGGGGSIALPGWAMASEPVRPSGMLFDSKILRFFASKPTLMLSARKIQFGNSSMGLVFLNPMLRLSS